MLVPVAEPGRGGGDLAGEGLEEWDAKGVDGGGESVAAGDGVVGVGTVGAGNDAAGLDLEPAEDVFVRGGMEAGGDAVIDIDEAAGAAGGGGLLESGIERRGGGDDLVEKVAEGGIDGEAAGGIDLADDGLWGKAGEAGDLVIGQKREDRSAGAVMFDFEDSHAWVVS